MVRQIAENVVDALRTQPFALALVVLNVLVLIGFAYTLREVGKGIERKDALVAEFIRNCTKP